VTVPGGLVWCRSAEDGRVVVWDLRSRVSVCSFAGSAGGEAVTAVRWAGGGQQLYAAAMDGSISAFLLDGSCVASTRAGADVRCLEVGPGGMGGAHVVVAGCGDASLRVFSTAGGMISQVACVEGAHEEAIACVGVDWAGARIATGSQDRSIKIWHALVP
jgi:WD40 repeat protein